MKPQKALHLHLELDKKKPKSLGGNYAIFEKYDGWYGYMDLFGSDIYSRAGRKIPSLRELSEKIRPHLPKVRGRLIFEIMIEGLEIDSFPTLNGILNRKHEQADDVYLMVHDFVPFGESSDAPFKYRYNLVREIVDKIGLPEVRVAPIIGTHTITDPSSNLPLKLHANQVWERGGEGIILKDINAPYMPEKRNHTLLKIKEELTLDMVVYGVEAGKVGGKYENTLGTLLVREKSGLTHTVSGMTDEQRDRWWAGKDIIVGRVVEIKAMKRNKDDGSLREPRFKAIRWDKGVDDID